MPAADEPAEEADEGATALPFTVVIAVATGCADPSLAVAPAGAWDTARAPAAAVCAEAPEGEETGTTPSWWLIAAAPLAVAAAATTTAATLVPTAAAVLAAVRAPPPVPAAPAAGASAGRSARRGAAARRTTEAEKLREQTSAGRGQERERAAHGAQLTAKVAATVAVAQVPAGTPRAADPAAVGERQLGANLPAGGIARLRRLDEADARPHEQRLDGGHADVQRTGEVGITQALELAHQQRRTLLVGEPAHIGDQAAQVLAALCLVAGVAAADRIIVEQIRRCRRRAPQLVDAAIVGHAVQPRPQRDRPPADPQRLVSAQEDVLHGVLGVGARPRQHLTRVGEQADAVAVVDRAEGVLAARSEEGDELVIGSQPQESRGERDS